MTEVWTRIALAFALSRNPAHAEAEIERLDSGAAAPPGAEWLLLAAPDVETAERLHRVHSSRTIFTELSYDLVERFGPWGASTWFVRLRGSIGLGCPGEGEHRRGLSAFGGASCLDVRAGC